MKGTKLSKYRVKSKLTKDFWFVSGFDHRDAWNCFVRIYRAHHGRIPGRAGFKLKQVAG